MEMAYIPYQHYGMGMYNGGFNTYYSSGMGMGGGGMGMGGGGMGMGGGMAMGGGYGAGGYGASGGYGHYNPHFNNFAAPYGHHGVGVAGGGMQ